MLVITLGEMIRNDKVNVQISMKMHIINYSSKEYCCVYKCIVMYIVMQCIVTFKLWHKTNKRENQNIYTYIYIYI